METGTLKELNVKPGDVVGYTFGHKSEPVYYDVKKDWIERALTWEEAGRPYWRIISRASAPQPKLWRDMTPEEKGALLLAAHEGKVIEGYIFDEWHKADWSYCPSPMETIAYRVRPEPKRKTVVLWISPDGDTGIKIGTIDMIDGKPDPDSIRMEQV